MMELIESAIPVIQQARPSAGGGVLHGSGAREPVGMGDGGAKPGLTTGCDQTEDGHDHEAAALDATVAQLHRALERLRLQHAQLTSGAILQQYQRQSTTVVEDSRPATKVLSVQG